MVASDEGAPRRLDGRVAVVTGASRGIGFGIAERLVAEGARVMLTARSPEPLAEAVAALGPEVACGVAGKAHDPAHRDEVMRVALDRFGRIDILVNNAGTNPVYGPLIDLDLEAARKILEVNVLAALAWTQRFAALTTEGGAVVNISSVSAFSHAPGIAFYGVSKAALNQLTRSLAAELGPAIRVNAVAPAVVKTRFAAALYEGREEQVAARYPMQRLGVPSDVASAVAYLASDDASWVTGQILSVDGGGLTAAAE
ncbi:SDR family oxidoreductase [Rhodococcus coprophilus]|uniref:3-ketoacyl-ACP reductase n=1 Tax=Rhodococcus coprophilus TaxID=38310 RepID=A0A2X4ULG3_9NOCA|nr:SDR family oxidoreductase [Rhodococcus coprophilus]MBM7460370.1 3-oxoacyl-[acyl-carrier protein] reductase [Rhodococcus coprophilus]SQI39551.1 3-ketoacyl-ACP reductase [Rhodococcus coprophilus]